MYEFKFTPENLELVLPIIGQSMLGIFAVIGVIILCVMGLTAAVRAIEERKNEKEKSE